MFVRDCKEIQPVHSEGDQPWDFFGRNDAKAETPILWPPHAKRWLTGKDSDAGRDWGQEEKGATEDEMAGWHHRLDELEFEWTPGVGARQGGLACCDSWGCKELDTTEQLNWTELNCILYSFVDYEYYSISSKGFLSAVVDIMVIWIKFAQYGRVTIKAAEHRRTDALELWFYRRLLRVPWTARRSNQSILKEINPEYSLEGLMLKLKLQ